MNTLSSDKIKQFLLLLIILFLACTLGWQLRNYLPGLLGAVTLYILMRKQYFRLVVIRGWKKWLAAVMFILMALIIILFPFYWLMHHLVPMALNLADNPGVINNALNKMVSDIRQYAPQVNINETQMNNWLRSQLSHLPALLGATADVLINTALAFFLLYFMLTEGRRMERAIQKFLILKNENVNNIWEATRIMVISNAIGLPVMAASQAFAATIGYWIFGVSNALLWGVITGIFSVFPIVGTAVVWIPVSLYLFATGQPGQAIGLLIFSFAVIVNLDHVLRFTLLKKIGNVHPVITILGVLAGVPLFGFMGFIFGPLLISYLVLMAEVYRIEFSQPLHTKTDIKQPSDPQ